jgi:hypothetical protein
MSQQSNQHLEIVPSNVTSDGKLSFRDGQPVIQFIIGEQERYLLGQTLRLVGEFAVLDGSALAQNNAQMSMDGRTSLYSCIDQLVIKSQATNQTIEHIRDYNRFMSSYLASTNDLNDGLSFNNAANLQMLNSKAVKSGLVDADFGLDTKATSFALSLPSGLFNGSPPIPLSRGWGVGGLIIEIHLAPDNNVLYALNGTGTDISDGFYRFQNVSLCCEVQTPAPSDLAQLQKGSGKGGTFEYNSISSYYTTFNSTNAIINFSLGLSNVLSVFCNFITSKHINNRNFNGMTTYYPMRGDNAVAKIFQVVFTRGGERMPLDYNIDTVQKQDSDNGATDSQVYRNYINAIQSFSKNMRNTTAPENMIVDLGKTAPKDGYEKYIDGGANVGVGVAFDTISNQGLDFSTTQFGLQMDTDLVDDNPQSVYMFVKSKQTMVFNQQGIQIIN